MSHSRGDQGDNHKSLIDRGFESWRWASYRTPPVLLRERRAGHCELWPHLYSPPSWADVVFGSPSFPIAFRVSAHVSVLGCSGGSAAKLEES